MNIRREPTYLSTETWRVLWLLAKSGKFDKTGVSTTPDEIADDILRTTIREKYPQLFEHQKKVESMERELLKTL